MELRVGERRLQHEQHGGIRGLVATLREQALLQLVEVADTGAGLAQGTPGQGIGLANIRDRLTQAYGDRHRFETRDAPGGGFTVTIDIPFIVVRPPAESMTDQVKAVVTV